MTDHLDALRLFVRVAATGSFSQAARELSLSQPTASRIISALEKRLGGTLFTRTTRAITLTETGADYLAKIKTILEDLDAADDAFRGTGELRGTLRIGMASLTASRDIIPCLTGFAELHPFLKIDLVIEDRRQDLILDNVDVALRFGKLADSSAIARRIGVYPMGIAAAPSYLERYGTPESPTDLLDHVFVVAGPAAAKGLTLRKDGTELFVPVQGRIAISSSEVALNAGIAGFGLVAGTLAILQRDFDRGELVRLLPDWDMGSLEAYALFPSGHAPKPSARAFIEYITRHMHTQGSASGKG